MVYGMDREVGDIMSAVTANGLDNNTIIVFLNDNGGYNSIQNGLNLGDDNYPLNGYKGLASEGGIRVPFLIKAPGLQPGIYDSPIIEQDLLPTFVDAAGGDASQFQTDGVNLIPHLSGADPIPSTPGRVLA